MSSSTSLPFQSNVISLAVVIIVSAIAGEIITAGNGAYDWTPSPAL